MEAVLVPLTLEVPASLAPPTATTEGHRSSPTAVARPALLHTGLLAGAAPAWLLVGNGIAPGCRYAVTGRGTPIA